MKKLKSLVRSYGFWTALAGALVVFVGVIGDACGFKVKDKLITDIVMAVAGLLVVFGVVTMPTTDSGENKTTEQPTVEDKDAKVDAEDITKSEESKETTADDINKDKE